MGDVVFGGQLAVEVGIAAEHLLAGSQREILVQLAACFECGQIHAVDVSVDGRVRLDDEGWAFQAVLLLELVLFRNAEQAS